MKNGSIGSTRVRGWCFRILLFVYDAVAVNVSYFFAVVLRFSDGDSYVRLGTKYMSMFRKFAPIYTCVCVAVFLLFHLYGAVWRYAGINDLKRLFAANLGTCILYVAGTLLIVGRMPISVYILGAAIQLVLISAPRLLPRYIIENYGGSKGGKGDIDIPLMLIGVCENTRIIQGKITKDKSNIVKPVCVIDYTNGYIGKSFNGLPVISGQEAVEVAVKKYGIRCAIVADTNLPKVFLDNLQSVCKKNNIELRGFVIGTEYQTRRIGIRDILGLIDGSVRIVSDSLEEKAFPNGASAAEDIREDYVVDGVSSSPENQVILKIRKSESAHMEKNEDWIRQYREETGSDISFF